MNKMHETAARPPPELDTKQGMVINCAAYQGGCRVADIDLDQAREVGTRDGRFVWIGLHEPDQALLYTVQQRFGLHDLAIEDALRAHQRPKLEIYGDTLFIVVRTASLQDRKIRFGGNSYLRGPRLRCDGTARFYHGLQGAALALRGCAEDAGNGRGLRRLFDHGFHRRQLFPNSARTRK